MTWTKRPDRILGKGGGKALARVPITQTAMGEGSTGPKESRRDSIMACPAKRQQRLLGGHGNLTKRKKTKKSLNLGGDDLPPPLFTG